MKKQQGGADHLNGQDRVWLARHEQVSTSAYQQLVPADNAVPVAANTSKGNLAGALEHLKTARLSAYCLDLSRAQLAIPAARVVVPGLQSANPNQVSKRLEKAAMANKINLKKLSDNLVSI